MGQIFARLFLVCTPLYIVVLNGFKSRWKYCIVDTFDMKLKLLVVSKQKCVLMLVRDCIMSYFIFAHSSGLCLFASLYFIFFERKC